MSFTNQELKDLLGTLDEIKKEVLKEEKYPFSDWEKNRNKVKERLRKLPELIERACCVEAEKRAGRPKELDLKQRLSLFLFVRTMNRSNRDAESLMLLLRPLFGFEVNYKYVERLYSDEEVKLALHNLFVLLLENEESSKKLFGDGSGYSLGIAKHYRTSPKKEGKSYVYVFRAIDLKTSLYVAFGYSKRSESEAFRKAMKMLKGFEIDSIALDRYYSSRSVLRIFGAKTSVYVIPKKNICNFGAEWMRVLKKIIKAPAEFLKSYFKRNLSESGFSSDKRRFGWRIRQKRDDRREQALFCTTLLHNIFFVRRAMG